MRSCKRVFNVSVSQTRKADARALNTANTSAHVLSTCLHEELRDRLRLRAQMWERWRLRLQLDQTSEVTSAVNNDQSHVADVILKWWCNVSASQGVLNQCSSSVREAPFSSSSIHLGLGLFLPYRRVDKCVFLDVTSIRTSGGDLSSGQFVFPGWGSDGGQFLICWFIAAMSPVTMMKSISLLKYCAVNPHMVHPSLVAKPLLKKKY